MTEDEMIDYECERRGYDPEGVRALLLALRISKILRFMREYSHNWEYDVQLPGYDMCEADMSRWTRVSVVGE
jgi:hypothetical protein